MGETKKRIDELEKKLPETDARLEHLMWNMPNVLHESVPYGKSDEENVEIRKWGTPKGGQACRDTRRYSRSSGS